MIATTTPSTSTPGSGSGSVCYPVAGPHFLRTAGVTRLEPGALHTLALPDGQAIQLRIRSGLVWATLEGDATDHLLSAGEVQEFAGPGLLVLQALEGAAVFEG